MKDKDGDLRYTPCQAVLMRKNGNIIPDSRIDTNIDDDEYCIQTDEDYSDAPGGALDKTVQYWRDNFDSTKGKYEVPYMFDKGFNEMRKSVIRTKLMEYKEKTCVDLVEIPWEDTNEGPFAGKYDNVLWVS